MTKVIDIKDLSVSYGKNKALNNITLSVNEGNFLGIVGPNGGGKSTLIKAILGLVPIDKGSITVFGRPAKIAGYPIGYVPQFSTVDRRFPISLFDTVLSGRLRSGFSFFKSYTKEDRIIAQKEIEKVGLTELSKRQISELSGGEFQRMLIARALATSPKLLFLDEPTSSIDSVSKEMIYNLLKELNKTTTIILVTHDLLSVSNQIKHIARIDRSLVYYGAPL